MKRFGLFVALIGAAFFATPAAAREVSDIHAVSSVSLEPGEFRWQENAGQRGPVEVVVSLPLQVVYVYRAGELIGISTTSTGKPGKETPTGTFPILQKRRTHFSNLYNNAPMPFMQRLTWDGIALHGGVIPGYPASHGCIRLPDAFAQQLFAITRLGGIVHIVDTAPTPQEAASILRSPAPPRPPAAAAPPALAEPAPATDTVPTVPATPVPPVESSPPAPAEPSPPTA